MPHLLAAILLLIVFNTAIAGLLTLIEFGGGFWINLVFSQCIGFAIGLVNSPMLLRLPPGWRRWLALAAGLPASVALGSVVAHGLTDTPLRLDTQFWQTLAIGMMFAVIGSVVFLLAERVHHLDDEVRRRRLAEESQARRETEARLKLLQAQIEPHFLFNTLANVASLIDHDPPRARRLLDRLNDWLRLALTRARQEETSLGDELALLENWLEILAVRFGDRLHWTIEADAATRRLAFPPMLLQPLVENAVRHGIEPQVGGGHLGIAVRREGDRLRLRVSDDGVGLGQARPGQGTGLANVRARLEALYGNAGRLELSPRAEGGTLASLDLPCASLPPGASP